MGGPNFSKNDDFLADADFISNRSELRAELVAIITPLIGTRGRRRESYLQLSAFMDDFQKWPIGQSKSGNVQFTEILKGVKAGSISWPLAPLLSWMSFYHKDAAIELYKRSGLASNYGVKYRRYVGLPGQRSSARQNEAFAKKLDRRAELYDQHNRSVSLIDDAENVKALIGVVVSIISRNAKGRKAIIIEINKILEPYGLDMSDHRIMQMWGKRNVSRGYTQMGINLQRALQVTAILLWLRRDYREDFNNYLATVKWSVSYTF